MSLRLVSLLGMGLFFLTETGSASPLSDYWGEENVWWHGRATFSGQVVIPACSLMMEDAWQSVDMGETPVRDLQTSSVGPQQYFKLRLKDCELSGRPGMTGQHVRVIFDGARGVDSDRFAVTGQATGIDLQILDRGGYIARAGETMPQQPLEGNSQELDYGIRVVRNSEALSAGDYYAVLRFRLYYE
jgi:type 1 fimbria pilin